MRVCTHMCVCEYVCPQHGSPSVSRRAASCSPLISATQPHTLTGAHKHTGLRTPLSVRLFADTHLSVCLSVHIPTKLIKASHLPSFCLTVCLSICLSSKHSHMMGVWGGVSHTCHLASPAEAPSSAKWQRHKMAAARWLWQNGSLGGLRQPIHKGPGSFRPSCVHVWK